MITLQIKVAILLAISFLVYTLFLQKNRFYKERRIYLLITGICTVALPLVQFFVPKNLPLSIIYIPEIKIYAAQSPPGTQASHSIFQWAEWFYYAGLVIIL